MAVTQSTFSGPGGTGANGRTFAVTAVGTTATIASFQNVASGDTFLVVACSCGDVGGGLGTITVHWDSAGTNQLMTSLGAVVSLGTGSNTLAAFGLVNPTSGTKTLRIDSSGPDAGNPYVVGGISFQGSITSSVAAATEGYATQNNGGTPSGTSTATTGVSIPTGDIAVAWHMDGNSWTSVSGTEIDIDGDNPPLAGNFTSGAGSTITLTGTIGSSDNWAALIVGIKAATAGTVVGWGFEFQPTVPRGSYSRSRAAAQLVRTATENADWPMLLPIPTANFRWEWQIQPWQPPHRRPEQKGASFLRGDDGIQDRFNAWRNAGWEFTPSHLLPKFYPKAKTVPNSGDDGTQYIFQDWKNSGWEIQSVQPPHRRPEQKGAFLRGDDGTQARYEMWRNTGWEIQPYQPQHFKPEKAGSILIGDPGNEAIFTAVAITTPAWGWEFQPSQPPYHINRIPSLLRGDDGVQAQFINWFNYGWDIQSFQPPHTFIEKRGSSLKGDEGIQSRYEMWRNAGWEIQSPQPPHFRPEKAASIAPWVNVEPIYYNWQNFGWEIQSPQPPSYPKTNVKLGSLSKWEDGTEAQFINWFNTGWEIQAFQPPHFKPEKWAALASKEDGAEAIYVAVIIATPAWGWEFQPHNPRIYVEKRGAILKGDDGIEYQFVNWQNAGWEIQYRDIKHPKYNSPDIGDSGIEAVFIPPGFVTLGNWAFQQTTSDFPFRYKKNPETGDTGIQFPFIRFLPYGWEIQSYQPQHLGVEKRGVLIADGDRGIQFKIQFPIPLTNWAFDNFLMMPTQRQFLQKIFAGTIFGAVDAGFWPPGTILPPSNFDYIIRARRRARR